MTARQWDAETVERACAAYFEDINGALHDRMRDALDAADVVPRAEFEAIAADGERYRELIEMHTGEFPQFREQLDALTTKRDALKAKLDAIKSETDDRRFFGETHDS